MLTRRIAASACALCLVVPGLAAAKPVDVVSPTATPQIHNHSVAARNGGTAYGDTKGDLNVNRGQTLVGDSKSDLPRTTTPIAAPTATRAPDNPTNGTNGWQIAAFVEAGLLAAFGLGCAVALSRLRPRRRAAGMGV
ncbi:MAG TPA: hypothetical protein VF257_02345 [Solirubrobacteraceae bacterium]